MGEKGYSWPEAMLTLTILIVIFGTLLPLATNITSLLHNKHHSMRAAETAYQGAITYSAYSIAEGTRSIDGVHYKWIVEENKICVSYIVSDEVNSKCVDY